VAQLTQGLTPQKIALTIAIGSGIAMFPILGTTLLLCLVVGIFLKLNQPIIQAVNLVCAPIHFPFIYYSFRWGESLFGHSASRFEFRTMMALLREDPIKFILAYEDSALHAIVLWAVLVPFWTVAIYYVMLPVMRGIDRVRLENAAKVVAKKAPDHPVP
jgi:uncharacterized protein (DUF2062 family)